DDIGARFDVEANRRLVKNEQARAVQQRASDLETSHLSAGKVAHLVLGALGERNAREDVIRTLSTLAVADAVQRRMIGQVLDDREVEIEGARLEYDADHAQRFARLRSDVVAENADLTMLNRVEARQQREQRALPGSVETEQNCEGRGSDRDVHVVESPARAIRMANALDGDGRRLDGVHSVHYGPRRAQGQQARSNVARPRSPKAARRPGSS